MIEVQAPFSNTAETKVEKTLSPKVPGQNFQLQTIRFNGVLLPEVQAWVDDGRVVSYSIPLTHVLGQPRTNVFRFEDPGLAALFKLTFS